MDAERRLGSEFVGIGWALGLDGKCACDLDVEEPPEWWPQLGETAVNVTKRGKHLIFDMPEGRRIGNGTTKFPSQGWGEVRGAGGYIIIWWPGDRVGFDVAQLKDVVEFPHPEWLSDAGADVEGVSDTELEAFKASHPKGDMPWRAKGFETTLAKREPGGSRNAHAIKVACWIAREVAADLVSAAEGFGVLEQWWAVQQVTVDLDAEGKPKTRTLTNGELRRIERSAVAQLTDERTTEVRAKADSELAAHRATESQRIAAMVGTGPLPNTGEVVVDGQDEDGWQSLLVPGGIFVLDAPVAVVPRWGRKANVLWAQGEPLLLCGSPGVGKTTVAIQLVGALLGILPDVIGYPVAPGQARAVPGDGPSSTDSASHGAGVRTAAPGDPRRGAAGVEGAAAGFLDPLPSAHP